MFTKGLAFLSYALPALASSLESRQAVSLASCPGYSASNLKDDGSTVTADLTLAGAACNAYGKDITNLKLLVEYQTGTYSHLNISQLYSPLTEQRLHVKIYDQAEQVYQIQESVWPRPSNHHASPNGSALAFAWTNNPFSFAITRRSNKETLFNTSAASFVFEDQYVRLRTSLPDTPSLYGLGEHTDGWRLNTTNYTRTVSARCQILPTHMLIDLSSGTAMHTVLHPDPTFTGPTQCIWTTEAQRALTAYFLPRQRAWTSKLMTRRALSSSTMLLVALLTCTFLLVLRQRTLRCSTLLSREHQP
jgi:hypothetical protein